MALDSTVRWFHSDMDDAPQINAEAGDLIGILDACLVSGFGNKSVTGIEVVSEVATVTISSGHTYERHAVIRISGATPESLNGDWRVKDAPGGSTLTFDCPGISDVTATGTITAIRATPGYWEKAFADTHKAAYRSTHPDSAGFYLRIDDSATDTGSSPVRGYEAMTGIDAGTRPIPTEAQASDFVWRRSITTTGSLLPRPWTLIADEAWVWLLVDFSNAASNPAAMYQWGDIAAANPVDNFAWAVTAHAHGTPGLPGTLTDQNNLGGNAIGCWFARGIEGGVEDDPAPYARMGSMRTTAPGDGEPFPAEGLGGYLFHYPVLALSEGVNLATGRVRGIVPGLMQGLTSNGDTIPTPTILETTRVIVEPSDAFPRAIMLTSVSAVTSTESYAVFDLWGPWR